MYKDEAILEALSSGNVEKAKSFLESNIREKYSLNSGKRPEDVKIIGRIMKVNEKTAALNEMFHAIPAELSKGKYFIFFTPYYAVASKDNFGYKEEKDDRYKICQLLDQFLTDPDKYQKININYADIKAQKKINKAEKHSQRYSIKTNRGRVILDPDYLIDVLSFVQTDNIYISDNDTAYRQYIDENLYMNPVFLKNDKAEKYAFIMAQKPM